MKRSGISLVELLVVIAIVGVLASLVFSIGGPAIRRAKITASLQNLHQIHVALKLYQMDQGADGVYGGYVRMGLPPEDKYARAAHSIWGFGLPDEVWRSACGPHPDLPWAIKTHVKFYYSQESKWIVAVTRLEDQMPVFADLYCADPDVKINNVYYPRRGLGVLLSGQLVNRTRTGDMYDFDWWTSNQEDK